MYNTITVCMEHIIQNNFVQIANTAVWVLLKPSAKKKVSQKSVQKYFISIQFQLWKLTSLR